MSLSEPTDTRLLSVHPAPATAKVDLVLVHGLGGDERSTWQSATDSDATSSWPNWLAEELPDVRIWSAGYPTTMTSWFAQTLPIPALAGNLAHRLRNQGVGDRPIVWVGHSMGGLVIKQILSDAALRSNPELKRLWLNTFAIQFLATPHSGSDLAGLAVFLTRCAQWSLAGAGLASAPAAWGVAALWSVVRRLLGRHRLPPANMAELQRHAPPLAALNFSFQQHVQTRHRDGPWPRIVAYRETQLMKGALVVQPDSADPQIADAEVVDLPFDHQTICKHRSRAAPYEWLVKQLAVLARLPLQRAAPAPGVVFVSYLRTADAATASDAAVYELVAWLRGQGVQLVVDIDHLGQRAPEGGWSQWAGRCALQAQTVLLIGHAAYPAAFEDKRALPDKPENAADPADLSFGSAVVTRVHYQQHAANLDKFIPLLKDGDPMSYLPNALHDWWNGLRFPSGRMAILDAIAAPTRAVLHTQAKP